MTGRMGRWFRTPAARYVLFSVSALVLVLLVVGLGLRFLRVSNSPKETPVIADAYQDSKFPSAPTSGDQEATDSMKQPPNASQEPGSTNALYSPRSFLPKSGASAVIEFTDLFNSPTLDQAKWHLTKAHDCSELVVATAFNPKNQTGRLRLMCRTIGTDDATVKSLGVRSTMLLDLTGQKRLSLEFDWNEQFNGSYLTGAVYLCPTSTDADPSKEKDWLKIEYVGVPPGKTVRAAVWLKTAGVERWLYDEGWPRKQRAGRHIGKVALELILADGSWEIIENGSLLYRAKDEQTLPFNAAHLYLQMTSHSNYPSREVFFDDVVFESLERPITPEGSRPETETALSRKPNEVAAVDPAKKSVVVKTQRSRAETMALRERISRLEKRATANPRDRRALLDLYAIHVGETHNPTRAAEAARRLAEIQPGSSIALYRLARASADAHRVDDALNAYAKLCELDPSRRANYCEQASNLCRNEKRGALAAEWALKIASVNEEQHFLQARAARQLQRLGLHDKARVGYDRASKLAPDGSTKEAYQLEVASLLLELGEAKQARDICLGIIERTRSETNRLRATEILETAGPAP